MSPSTSAEMVPVMGTFPEPHVEWYSRTRFEREFGYPPGAPETVVRDEVLEEHRHTDHLTLSRSRSEALFRIAQLWNGDQAGPNNVHLIAEKAPSWTELLGDLPQHHLDPLRPTVVEQPPELVEAFGDRDWFQASTTRGGWLKTTHIARSRADYDLQQRTRVLINEQPRFPQLRGDPFEGLKHRFGVGLEATRATLLEGRAVHTYKEIGDYTVDLLEYDPGRGVDVVGEVLTGHHNNQLYRSTYAKLVDLDRPAILVVDDWQTARRVFNHWQAWGVDVPGAPFESSLRVDWVRRKVQEAAADPTQGWPIEDVLSVSTMWDIVFEQGDAPSRRDVISLDW